MRRFVSAIVIAACITSAALAQDDASPLAFRPTWEVEPTATQNVTHYPRQALAQNISGFAVLCCRPRADRSLDCNINSEWPADQGFGAATQRASQVYRLSPESTLDLERRPEAQIRLSMIWAGAIVTDDVRNTLVSMDQDTLEACLSPPA